MNAAIVAVPTAMLVAVRIPTLMLFKDGELLGTKVGALSKAQLQSFLEAHV